MYMESWQLGCVWFTRLVIVWEWASGVRERDFLYCHYSMSNIDVSWYVWLSMARFSPINLMYTYKRIYIHAYIQTSIHPSIHTYMHTYKHTYIHTWYIQTHTYMHAYIHTYPAGGNVYLCLTRTVSHKFPSMGDVVSQQFRGNHPLLKLSVITPGKRCPMVIADIFRNGPYYHRTQCLPRKFLWHRKTQKTLSPTVLHIYIHTYKHTYIHTHTHTYTHTYIHTYIHTCMHKHTHTTSLELSILPSQMHALPSRGVDPFSGKFHILQRAPRPKSQYKT